VVRHYPNADLVGAEKWGKHGRQPEGVITPLATVIPDKDHAHGSSVSQRGEAAVMSLVCCPHCGTTNFTVAG
jgi:hypothetical protein